MDPRTLRDYKNEDLRQKIIDLERSLAPLASDLAACDQRANLLRAELTRQTAHLNTIRNELERRLTPAPNPRISDHALLRYIERVLQINIEKVRQQVLTDSVIAAIRAGATGVTVNGVKFVVNGVTIVTTLGEDQQVKRKTAQHGRNVIERTEASDIANGVDEYYEERDRLAS